MSSRPGRACRHLGLVLSIGMERGGKRQDTGPAGGRKGDTDRADRLRQALRDNLKKRKTQARGRKQAEAGASHDSAGFLPDKSDQ
jgi:hypothetical protein